MINRRSFLKKAAVLAATPVLARLPFELKAEASPSWMKYELAFPRDNISANFSMPIAEGRSVKKYIHFNKKFKRIYLTRRMHFHDFFCYIQNEWDKASFLVHDVPIFRITPNAFTFNRGWEFGDSRSPYLMMDASFDGYVNIRTIGTIEGESLKVYYRINRNKWEKFILPVYDSPNLINEPIKWQSDSTIDFVLVDEKRATIVDGYTSKLYRSNIFVPLCGMGNSIDPIKRLKWNHSMSLSDAQEKAHELWVKDLP